MRIRKICLLLTWVVMGVWGLSSPVLAATDSQRSQYEVQLAPPKSVQSGSDSAVVSGNEDDAGQSNTGNTNGQAGTGADAATVTGSRPTTGTAAQAATATKPTTGRLPQLSEQQWAGFGLLGVIILGLMFWVWKLSRRNRRS